MALPLRSAARNSVALIVILISVAAAVGYGLSSASSSTSAVDSVAQHPNDESQKGRRVSKAYIEPATLASPNALALSYAPNIFTDPDVSVTHHVNTADGHIILNAGNVDTGQVSLRSAIIAANINPGADTITLGNGTYSLTIPAGTGAEPAQPGLPAIGDVDVTTSGLTINGNGAANTTIQQTSGIDRVIDVNPPYLAGNFFFTINGVTITGGRSMSGDAGGLYSGSNDTGFMTRGKITVTNCVFKNNTVTNPGFGGGAIQNFGGDLEINNCTFGGVGASDPNSAGTSGGGVAALGANTPAVIIITNSTFINNTANGLGGGGLDLAANGAGSNGTTATVSNCTFTGNQALGTGSGGGILNESLITTVSNCQLINNSAANRGGGIYVGGGSLHLNGTSPSITFTGNTAGIAASTSMSTSGPVTLSGTNTTIGGSIEISTNGSWTNNAGSTIAPTNVQIIGGTFNANNSTMNIGGNLTIQPGAVVGATFNAGTSTINITGNLTTDAGGAMPATSFNAGTGTFNFNGSGSQTISGTLSPTFFNLTDSNTTQPLTLNNNIAVNGTLNVNGANATLAPVAGTVISGSGTLTGTGTARVTRTAATPDFLSQYTITNKTLTNLTVEYIGAAAQSVSATTYGGLKINNASGASLGGAVTVNGTLTLTAGALGVGTNTLNINNGSSVGAGSLTSALGGTVNYNQGSNGQIVLAANYGNLTFSNFNKVLPNSGTVGIANTFAPGSAVGHTITGSTVDFNGTNIQTVPAFNYNNLTISGARTTNNVTLANGGTIGVAGTFSPTATFTSGTFVITGNTINFNGAGSQTISAFTYNNLTSSNNGARTLASSGIIRIANLFTPGTNTYTLTGSTVEYNGTAAQTLPSGFTTYNNLTLNNTAGTTGFAGLIVQGLLRVQAGTFTSSSTYKDVQIDSGATLAASSGSTINVTGNWTNNGNFTANNGTVNFNGSAAQTISGSSTTTFNNLTINDASGVTLNANITINATLTLTAGALAIGSRTLTLNNGITITGGSFTSAATGTVNYNQSSNGQNIAPGNYGNLTLSNFTKTLPSSGTVKIAGAFTVGVAGGHTFTGSTVEFNGTAAQTLPPNFPTYNNLTLNNTAGVTGFAGLTVQNLLRVAAGTFTSSSTYKDVQIDSGATLAGVNATTINISGSWTKNGTFNANSNTVNFNGTAAQSIGGSSATTFNNLTINNAAGVSLGNNATVGGALTLTSGAFAVGSNTLTLNGAITATGGSLTSGTGGTVNYNQSSNGQAVLAINYGNLTFSNFTKTLPSSGTVRIAGTFTTGAAGGHTITGSTIEFNGSAAQTMPAGFTTYNNLTSNNAAGITLGGNITVNAALTLTSGNITTNANVLSVASAGTISRASGHVIGNLKKTFGGIGSFIYHVGTANGYSPVNTTVTAGTGDLTVKAVQGPQPVLVASMVLQRYWTLAGTGITANLVFNYLQSDVLGTEANYRVIRVSSGTAVSFPNACPSAPCVNAANNTATISGVTSFSDWTAGDFSGPTAVEFESFAATAYDRGTFIHWRTGSEADNLGFNLYREEGGRRVLVNPQIVAGSALVTGSRVRLGAGRSYRWWDAGSKDPSARYWIEDVDLNGDRTLHGPVPVKHAGGAPAEKSSADLLSQIGAAQSGVTRPLPITAPLAAAKPDQISLINSLAGQPAVKLSVRHDGFYRVSGADLSNAGLNLKADSEKLQLYADGRQVPIKVATDKQGLIASVEFYGVGLDTAETDARVYWLVAGREAGLRITQVKGSGFATTATSFLSTVERRDSTVYFSSLRNGEKENFFGAVIAGEPVEQSLALPNVEATAGGQATIEVALQGVTALQHRVWAYINGTFAGELVFDGQSQGQAKFTLQQSQLREGDNQLRLAPQEGPGDVSLVDFVRVSYWHRFAVDGNALRLTATGRQAVTVSGFTTAAVRVFDVTEADAVEELAAQVEQQEGNYSATFAPPRAGERKLLVLADEKAERPAGVAQNQASDLRGKNNAAAFVIITRRDFFPAFDRLAQLRASRGFKSELIDVEDIYDEFSFGNKTAQAVKDFLQYAKTSWKTGPRFVLLGADSSFDPKNYLGLGDWDIAPSKLIDTGLMETASDDWLADFNDDGLPELAVGRLPVRSAEEAAAAVAKIISYEGASPSEEVLLVADANDGFDFEGANKELRALIPTSLRVNEIDRGGLDAETARGRLMEAINRGQKVVNYTGHGSVDLWRGNLLTSEDASLMENRTRPSLFIMMTCLNGYSNDPALESLAESLMKAEGGAIAVWSSSGMTDPGEQAAMNRAVYRLIFGESGRTMTIGEMFGKAKAEVSDADVRRTWILIGDPMMKLR